MISLKFKKLHPNAKTPVYASDGAACFDLFAVGEGEPHPTDGRAVIFRTGLAFEVRKGYAMQIFSRSGQGFKHAIRLSNCVGIIDSDYRGEVCVSLCIDDVASDPGFMHTRARVGDAIAQAWVVPVQQMLFIEAEDLSDTARGAAGFGSTNKTQ